MEENQKVVLTGIKPSGDLTLGNYIGALRNLKAMEALGTCYYWVADMHAITVRQDPADLRRRTLTLIATYLACGIDPEKSVMFVQSQVPAHAELGWILNCYSYMGEMSRMTQFKEKSAKLKEDSITVGLFDYPVLMAADILLYQTDLVPVGVDQKQHLEIARDIAIRFNNAYSPTFKVPEAYIPPVGAKVMSLQDPTSKMSKSDEAGDAGCILLMDSAEDIRRKCKRAVTDLETEVRYDPEKKPGISNLMTIMSCMSGKSLDEIAREFSGVGYGSFKTAVADSVVDVLIPLQTEVKRLLADKAYLSGILKNGADHASYVANKTLSKVKKKIGFVMP